MIRTKDYWQITDNLPDDYFPDFLARAIKIADMGLKSKKRTDEDYYKAIRGLYWMVVKAEFNNLMNKEK